MSTSAAAVDAARGAAATDRTFAAFGSPSYRRFFLGQAVSLPGTWMQTVGQSWLVIELTGSGTALGFVTAAQFLPVLLLAPFGGLLADRFPKRRLLVATQATMGLSASVLGTLTVTGHASVAAVFLCAVVLGLATAVDNPTRQSFVVELVGPHLVRNAVSLNSVLVNAARAVGPAVAGLLIAAVGTGWCFLINAASFAGVIVALLSIRVTSTPAARPPATGALRQVRDGFAYVFSRPELRWPFLMIFIVGAFAWEFPITLPLLSRVTFDSGSEVYGWLTSAMGVGAVAGGLVLARRGRTGLRALVGSAALFGAAIAALAVAPTVWTAVIALLFVGAGSTAFMSMSNATMQLSSDTEHRGRVMSLWTMSFAGTTPIGGPLVGAVAEHLSPRWSLGLGAAACAICLVVPVLARTSSIPAADADVEVEVEAEVDG